MEDCAVDREFVGSTADVVGGWVVNRRWISPDWFVPVAITAGVATGLAGITWVFV